ncbi:MAG: helix-turn-helix domain-containing protein [Nocardioides sp.]|uniref:TetR/AcrR family transcriptional regulator n=1 Tax=Nocardioides sp. TaxID=35761 RepID=UPI0039E643A1
MAPSPPTSSRSRGRPVEIDRDHLAEVALRLFEERGYVDVSAAEIASAAGISRRSLFRYFPTKADLVWDRLRDDADLLDASLASADGAPIDSAVDALVRTAEQTPVLALTRGRLKVVEAHHELFAFGIVQLRRQHELLRSYLVGRGFGSLQAQVIASALTMATYDGYLRWAVSDSPDHPAVAVRDALAALALF